MISFTNPLILWAFPVLALPWIFRRRQKARIQVMNFSLLNFLRESEEKEFLNPHLQEFLLLILRTLLLALLLAALAGPKWIAGNPQGRSWISYLPFARTFQTTLLVLDTSYSMGYGAGETSWWSRAARAWNQIQSGVAGLSTDVITWDQTNVKSGFASSARTLTFHDLKTLFANAPKQPGASVGELFSLIRRQFPDHQSIIIVTDGQKYPWQELLNSTAPPLQFPSVLAVTVGEEPTTNAWLEIDACSSPPWGISGWETLSGFIHSSYEKDGETGALSLQSGDPEKTLEKRTISFPGLPGQIASQPFRFTFRYSDLLADDKSDTPQISKEASIFLIHLESKDRLPLDNDLSLRVPLIQRFTVGIADNPAVSPSELAVLQSALNPLANTKISPPVVVTKLISPQITYAGEVDLAILAYSFLPGWTPAETSTTLDFLKNGGSAIIFTGGTDKVSEAWNNLLQELGWKWSFSAEDASDPLPVKSNNASWLDQSLAAWDETMWKTWIPQVHGITTSESHHPLISYEIGKQLRHLIVEVPLGKGKVWLVNTSLTVDAKTLLSPILPVFLWEVEKAVARTKQNTTFSLPPRNEESDLRLLSSEEKKLLTERFGIRFASLENLPQQLSAVYGGTDFRLALLFLCLTAALGESWLSNRLASR